MKTEPRPGKAVAEPLWVIAVALFVIAGAVGYYGYLDLQRRPEATVAVVHAPVPVGVGVAGRKPATVAVATDAAGVAANSARSVATGAGPLSPMVSNAVPAVTLPLNASESYTFPETNARAVAASGPTAEIWNRRIIFDKDAGGIPSIPLQTITGVVRLRGTPPAEKVLPIDPACAAARDRQVSKTRFYLVGTNGGLADVFVHVFSGLQVTNWALSVPPLFINQQGCEYVPYVGGTQTGQSIWVRNSDPVLHNVHPTPTVAGNREYNRAHLPKSPDLEFSWQKPELFLRFKCDVHPWMFAYVSVVEHPFFAVTDTNGNFRMPAPPPGRYGLAATSQDRRRSGIHRRRAGKRSDGGVHTGAAAVKRRGNGVATARRHKLAATSCRHPDSRRLHYGSSSVNSTARSFPGSTMMVCTLVPALRWTAAIS